MPAPAVDPALAQLEQLGVVEISRLETVGGGLVVGLQDGWFNSAGNPPVIQPPAGDLLRAGSWFVELGPITAPKWSPILGCGPAPAVPKGLTASCGAGTLAAGPYILSLGVVDGKVSEPGRISCEWGFGYDAQGRLTNFQRETNFPNDYLHQTDSMFEVRTSPDQPFSLASSRFEKGMGFKDVPPKFVGFAFENAYGLLVSRAEFRDIEFGADARMRAFTFCFEDETRFLEGVADSIPHMPADPEALVKFSGPVTFQ